MSTTEITTATIIDENITFSVSEICTYCDISKELLVQMMEHGVFNFSHELPEDFQIDLKTVKRIESAYRLHRDLEINIPGVALILELQDELAMLRDELNLLHRHLTK